MDPHNQRYTYKSTLDTEKQNADQDLVQGCADQSGRERRQDADLRDRAQHARLPTGQVSWSRRGALPLDARLPDVHDISGAISTDDSSLRSIKSPVLSRGTLIVHS